MMQDWKSLGLFIIILLWTSLTWADKNETTMQLFRDAGAASYIDTAYGYAVFPTIGKGGILIGGAHGKGTVFRGDQIIGETSMTQVSLGFLAGGQTYSQVVFFEDPRALREFTSGNFKFGAQAAAVALNAGASVEASTGGGARTSIAGEDGAEVDGGGYRDGMAVFTIALGGLMIEASLGGQRFRFRPISQVNSR